MWHPGENVIGMARVGDETRRLLPNQVGTLVPRLDVKLNDTVAVELRYPEGTPGDRVVAVVEDGGQLNEKQRSLIMTLDDQQKVNFQFTANGGAGIFRVTLRHGGDQKELEFWMDSKTAMTTASN